MKERPILFSAPMVRALLNGTKTQTRRVVKPQPSASSDTSFLGSDGIWRFSHPTPRGPVSHEADDVHCPYGKPGDRLWVKEAHYLFGQWFPNNAEHTRWSFEAAKNEVLFPAPADVKTVRGGPAGWWKRNSLFMPRWASRITLELTGVRVERLQDISEADAVAEGCITQEIVSGYDGNLVKVPSEVPHPQGGTQGWDDAREWYADLWDAINGTDAWDANPWVWVVEFKRVKP